MSIPNKKIKRFDNLDDEIHRFDISLPDSQEKIHYTDILNDPDCYNRASNLTKNEIANAVKDAYDIDAYKKMLRMGYVGNISDFNYHVLRYDDAEMMTLLLKNSHIERPMIDTIIQFFKRHDMRNIVENCFKNAWTFEDYPSYKIPINLADIQKIIKFNDKMAIVVIEIVKPHMDEILVILKDALNDHQNDIYHYLTSTYNDKLDLNRFPKPVLKIDPPKNIEVPIKIDLVPESPFVYNEDIFVKTHIKPLMNQENPRLENMRFLKDEHLQHFREKKVMTIRNCPKVTDDGFRYLENVKELTIENLCIKGTFFKYWKKLNKITIISAEYINFNLSDIRCNSEPLFGIDISSCHREGYFPEKIHLIFNSHNNNPNLKDLNNFKDIRLSNLTLREDNLPTDFRNVEKLTLNCCVINVEVVKRLNGIKKVFLNDCVMIMPFSEKMDDYDLGNTPPCSFIPVYIRHLLHKCNYVSIF